MDNTVIYYDAPPPPPAGASHSPYSYHHPPPPYSPYANPSHSSPTLDEVRTLFVAGFPEDVKSREIYNLFREFPGYESCNLRSASKHSLLVIMHVEFRRWYFVIASIFQPFAFAVFTDQQSAVAAMHALNGFVFDLEKGSRLYIDLAKSNSRSKRGRTDVDGPGSDKRFRVSPTLPRGSFDPGVVGSFQIPGMVNSAHSMLGYPSAQRATNGINAAKLDSNVGAHAPQNNPPCPTLFLAELGPRCTEQELIQLFSRCRGYLKLKKQGPVAFVDFQDTACSTEARKQLQGAILYSSLPGEGIRLEYAKSRMGKRRKEN